jgi:hypothetical protein
MQAIELEATIDARHGLKVDLPDNVPPGKARVIVLFEAAPVLEQRRVFGRFRGKISTPEDFNDPLPKI